MDRIFLRGAIMATKNIETYTKAKQQPKQDKPKKDRKFCLLLYPDCHADCEALKAMQAEKLWQVEYILHDKDELKPFNLIGKDGEFVRIQVQEFNEETGKEEVKEYQAIEKGGKYFKKPHWHIVLRFSSKCPARYVSGLAKYLNVELRKIQICGDFDGSLKYLIHYGELFKYHYPVAELHGDFTTYLCNLINSTDTLDISEQLVDICDFIEDNNITRLSDLVRYVAVQGFTTAYRQYQNTFINMINENRR